MPRQKKQHLKKRKDGRYVCRYKNLWFYGWTEDEALTAREEYKKQEKAGLRPVRSMTLADYAADWLAVAHPNVAYRTYEAYRHNVEVLLNALGEKPLADVMASDIKRYYSTYFAGYSDMHIQKAKQTVVAIFDAAVSDGLILRNPAREKSAQPHKGTKGSHRAITPQERHWIDTLCLNHRARPAVMAMLYEGLRPQEAKALDVSDIDFEAGIVHVHKSIHIAGMNRYSISETMKTESSRRDIPLFAPFREAVEGITGPIIKPVRAKKITISGWLGMWASYVYQMESEINGIQKKLYRKCKAHRLILEEAEQLRKQGKIEEAAAKEAEIPPWISFTVTPYDLRHSFATFCRDNGIEINTVIQWMGHADSRMLLNIYDEVSEDRSQKQAEKLEKVLIRSQNGSQDDNGST